MTCKKDTDVRHHFLWGVVCDGGIISANEEPRTKILMKAKDSNKIGLYHDDRLGTASQRKQVSDACCFSFLGPLLVLLTSS